MAQQFLLNLGMAFIWAFLSDSVTLPGFLFGYALGAFFLYLFYVQSGKSFYVRKLWKVFVLLAVFFKEIISANLVVLSYVLSPLERLNPGIIAIHVDFESDFELVLLANMITLTPGTLTLEISTDNKTLFLHVLDSSNPEELIRHIRREFVERIKEVTAP